MVTRGRQGAAAALAALALAAALAGCGGRPRGRVAAAGPTERIEVPPGAPTALFLGSSTTHGVGTSALARRWTTLLSGYAGWREENAGVPDSLLTDVARAGAIVSGEVGWRAVAPRVAPAVVVVMYGANDVRREVPLGEVGEAGTFRNAAAALVRGLRGRFPAAVLVVVTPQPSRALHGRRAEYDDVLAAEAHAAGGVLVRGDAAFPEEALPRLAADPVHLNDVGHAAFAAHVSRALVSAGVLPDPGLARGGRETGGAVPGGGVRLEVSAPLRGGVLRGVAVRWGRAGRGAIAVYRPTGRGAYRLVHRSDTLETAAGVAQLPVDAWRVLDGDVLAAWSDGAPEACGGAGPQGHLLAAEGRIVAPGDLAPAQLRRCAGPVAIHANPPWVEP